MFRKISNESYGIVGLGRFGTALAIKLAESGKEVIVLDSNESKVKDIRCYTDYAYVVKELTKEAFQETGIDKCDTVIVAIGEKIDISILVTLNLINLGVRKVISKAISMEQGMVLERLGAEVVYPERDMALRLAKKMLTRKSMEFLQLGDNFEISKIRVSSLLVGFKISELYIRQLYSLNIIAIEYSGVTEIEIDPEYRFRGGETLVVLGKKDKISRLEGDINTGSIKKSKNDKSKWHD